MTTFSVSNTGTGAMLWNAKVTPESDWFIITSGDSGTTPTPANIWRIPPLPHAQPPSA